MYPNPIKDKLRSGKPVLGTGLFSMEPHVAAEVLATGPDWIWIDLEHSPWGTESVGVVCVQARQAGVAGVIRVPWNTPGDIKKAYDVGAVGVMVPQVDTSAEAADAVHFAKYPPIGERGISPWFATMAGLSADDVTRGANDETILVLQMESEEAWRNIDEIVEVEHFDVLLAGPSDLSASLGFPTEIHHPRVEEIMREMPRRLEGTGKVAGTTFSDVNQCERWIDLGYTFMNIGSLLGFGAAVQRDNFQRVRARFA